MIDLRSDTITRPTQNMRKVMAEAEVGDDVFGDDPTVNRLQDHVAELLGKEAGLFVASGTMGNQVCIRSLTSPGDEVILESEAHIFYYEAGAPAMLSGVQLRTVAGARGVITADQIATVIRGEDVHFPPTRLICLENTHNRAGGTVFPIEEIRRIHKLAKSRNILMHLDGARLWNASVATGIPLSDWAQLFDSVTVCFSKGLGAPVGSLIAGDREFVRTARKTRKRFGGGMRQAGIIAAGALWAVEHNIGRLAEDHENAKRLARALANIPGVSVDLESVHTNIVFIRLSGRTSDAPALADRLKKAGVFVLALGPDQIRAVTHLEVSRQDIEQAIQIFAKVLK
jgi:threonine aldolase